MTTPAIASVPVRSAAELTTRWRTLLEPPVFRARSLWLAWFDSEGRQSPVVVPVDDLPEAPDPGHYAGMRGLNAAVAESQGPGCHIAMALCRPGRASVRDGDDAWVAGLAEVFDALTDQTWSLHLAAGGRVLPLVEPPASAWPGAES
jgi:hypothetical protein